MNRAILSRQRPDLFKYRTKSWMLELQHTLTQDAATVEPHEEAPPDARPT